MSGFIEREEYPISNWIIDLRDILAQRSWISKKDALLLIVEDLDQMIEMYEEGNSPQGCYEEYFKD